MKGIDVKLLIEEVKVFVIDIIEFVKEFVTGTVEIDDALNEVKAPVLLVVFKVVFEVDIVVAFLVVRTVVFVVDLEVEINEVKGIVLVVLINVDGKDVNINVELKLILFIVDVDNITLLTVVNKDFVFVVDKEVVDGIEVVIIGEFISIWQKNPSNPKLHKQTK